MLNWLLDLATRYGYIIVFLGVGIESMGVPVPGGGKGSNPALGEPESDPTQTKPVWPLHFWAVPVSRKRPTCAQTRPDRGNRARRKPVLTVGG